MVISLVLIQMYLGSSNPATLSTRKGLCTMHGPDVLAEVITILHDGITDGTSCYNSFVSDFFMLNLEEFNLTRETAIPAGKHCKTNSRLSEKIKDITWTDYQKENVGCSLRLVMTVFV